MPDDLTAEVNARIRARQGDALKQARTEAGLTRRQVVRGMEARGVVVTEQALAWWEAGERRPSEAASVALAKVLDVAWSDLFGLDGEAVA